MFIIKFLVSVLIIFYTDKIVDLSLRLVTINICERDPVIIPKTIPTEVNLNPFF